LVPAALARRGIELLRDERTRLAIGGESLDLVGLSYWTRRAQDISRIAGPARGPRLLLAHDPRRFREAQELGFPLLLSGHTHGGQIVVPGLGAVAARKFPVASGALRQGGTTLFGSRGVGPVYVPVRLNCPPEVSLLTLVSKPPGLTAIPRPRRGHPRTGGPTKRRPSIRQPPARTRRMASG
ncbi:MAG: hypothetical protein MUF60_04350, partial [Vicinamibacterales bacterium]|nr:hypothetical protein [Vicinamibacterales bacterium]